MTPPSASCSCDAISTPPVATITPTLKPDNMTVSDGGYAKVLDFGLAPSIATI